MDNNDKKDKKHNQGQQPQGDKTTQVMDAENQGDTKKNEHDKDADKIGNFES